LQSAELDSVQVLWLISYSTGAVVRSKYNYKYHIWLLQQARSAKTRGQVETKPRSRGAGFVQQAYRLIGSYSRMPVISAARGAKTNTPSPGFCMRILPHTPIRLRTAPFSWRVDAQTAVNSPCSYTCRVEEHGWRRPCQLLQVLLVKKLSSPSPSLKPHEHPRSHTPPWEY
jgi:hypothetical protein